jgi:hypothetical protein
VQEAQASLWLIKLVGRQFAKSNFSEKTGGLKQPLLIAVAIAAVTLPFHSEPGGGRAGGVLVGVIACGC